MDWKRLIAGSLVVCLVNGSTIYFYLAHEEITDIPHPPRVIE